MNYEIETSNYIECAIIGTDEPVNGLTIFSSFTVAKKHYISNLLSTKNQWQRALSDARRIKKTDIDALSYNY